MLLFRAKVALGLPFKLVWNLVRTRTLLGGESLSELLALPSLRLGGLGGGAGNWTMSLGQKGAQAVAGICGVMPWLCGKGVGRKKESYDVGKVARALHREGKHVMIDGVVWCVRRLMGRYEQRKRPRTSSSPSSPSATAVSTTVSTTPSKPRTHISVQVADADLSLENRVWELAAAVRTSSHLPDRSKLGTDLMQLGDLSRDLSDEIAYVSVFSPVVMSHVESLCRYTEIVERYTLRPTAPSAGSRTTSIASTPSSPSPIPPPAPPPPNSPPSSTR